MVAVVSLLLISLISLIVTRVATVALTLTGLSREVARFQARSALSGAGFTTTESEAVINHPVRRRIVQSLIFIGSVGLVSLMATLTATLITSQGALQLGQRGALLVVGLAVIYLLASSRWFDRALQPVMHLALRRLTDLDTRDYASLLHIAGDYAITEMLVEAGDWLADQTLIELRLPDEGVLVLGIRRAEGAYVGAPEGETVVRAGDTLTLYGRRQRLRELDQRDKATGSRMHADATREQDVIEAAQDPVPKRAVRAMRQALRRRGDTQRGPAR